MSKTTSNRDIRRYNLKHIVISMRSKRREEPGTNVRM